MCRGFASKVYDGLLMQGFRRAWNSVRLPLKLLWASEVHLGVAVRL